MTHTPGPWEVEKIQRGDYRVAISSEESEVACAYHMTDDPINADLECIANAKLIAAAPELLEGLKNAVQHIGCYQLQLGFDPKTDLTLEIFNAIIAKAEGRQ